MHEGGTLSVVLAGRRFGAKSTCTREPMRLPQSEGRAAHEIKAKTQLACSLELAVPESENYDPVARRIPLGTAIGAEECILESVRNEPA